MISVIIPTYNREKVIMRSVNSVLKQTYSDIEVLIIDDCSDDNTRMLIEHIKDERIRYVCLENRMGACLARNRGIELAKGEYIAFQDSDDEWYSNKLEKQLDDLKRQNADIVFCSLNRITPDNKVKSFPENLESHECGQRELIYESIASTQTILGKANAIKKIMFDTTLSCMQDYDFIIRASEKYKIYYSDEILVNVYVQNDSITASRKQYRKRLEITRTLLDKYKYLWNKYPEWKLKMLKIIAHCEIMLKDKHASCTLKDIYSKERTVINWLKILLYKLKIIYFIFLFEKD